MAAMIAQNAASGKTLRSASGAVVRATSNGASGRAGSDPAVSAATVATAATTASMPMARGETADRGSVDRANASAWARPAGTSPRLLSLTGPLSPVAPPRGITRPAEATPPHGRPGRRKSAAAAGKLLPTADAGPGRANL